jgi:ABC-type phosphonate transport system ATPase subunit
MVGGAMMRGVSGGQRKRVTTGEMMVGPAKTLLMDEISTGLDSSTTYLIVRCIRNYVHLLEVRQAGCRHKNCGVAVLAVMCVAGLAQARALPLFGTFGPYMAGRLGCALRQ